MTTNRNDDLPRLPFAQQDPLDIAPELRLLQEERPITRIRTATGDVAWMITRYDDIKALFADRRLGRSHPHPEKAARFSDSALLGGPFGDFDTELETSARMRRLLAPAFSARRMQAISGRVDALVDGLLDNLSRRAPPADLHRLLSLPLPVMVICELLGDRKSTRLNSSHVEISYAVFCLKKKKKEKRRYLREKKKKENKEK